MMDISLQFIVLFRAKNLDK